MLSHVACVGKEKGLGLGLVGGRHVLVGLGLRR